MRSYTPKAKVTGVDIAEQRLAAVHLDKDNLGMNLGMNEVHS
jgi:hypothetical protein